jgi:hypothetical protein
MIVRNPTRELMTRPPRRLGSDDPTARFPLEEEELPPPREETPSTRAPTVRD